MAGGGSESLLQLLLGGLRLLVGGSSFLAKEEGGKAELDVIL